MNDYCPSCGSADRLEIIAIPSGKSTAIMQCLLKYEQVVCHRCGLRGPLDKNMGFSATKLWNALPRLSKLEIKTDKCPVIEIPFFGPSTLHKARFPQGTTVDEMHDVIGKRQLAMDVLRTLQADDEIRQILMEGILA